MNKLQWKTQRPVPLGLIFVLLACLLVSACSPSVQAGSETTPTVVLPTETLQPTHTLTAVPSPTATITLTPTPTVTPTPVWIYNPPGKATVPILLYHHVVAGEAPNRYFVSLDEFKAQIQALKESGYTTIPVSLLVQALTVGAELPPRPIIITFDDGHADVFTNALPVLEEAGFTATMYLVSNYVDQPDLLNREQIKGLKDAGWEFGVHSMNHLDLTVNYPRLWDEMVQSRLTLQEITGTPLDSFAYPFGKVDNVVFEKVVKYGYKAGMGLGKFYEHTLGTLYYLSRIEVRSDMNVDQLFEQLPWR